MDILSKILENYPDEGFDADYFFYNIEGSYVGEQTPIFINLVND